MSDQFISSTGTVTAETGEIQSLPLHVEELAVTKRQRRTLVRATRITHESEVQVDEPLLHADVVIEAGSSRLHLLFGRRAT